MRNLAVNRASGGTAIRATVFPMLTPRRCSLSEPGGLFGLAALLRGAMFVNSSDSHCGGLPPARAATDDSARGSVEGAGYCRIGRS